MMIGFILNRTTGLLGPSSDIGNGGQPLALTSLFFEGCVVALAIYRLVLIRPSRPVRCRTIQNRIVKPSRGRQAALEPRITLRLSAVSLCLVIAGAISTPRPAGAAVPNPKALVTQTAAVMDRIPFVAATGSIVQLGAGGRRSSLQVTGACDASAVPRQYRTSAGRGTGYLKARAYFVGRLGSTSFDTHYILIGRGKTSTLWERSAQTRGRWRVNTVEGTSLPILDMCGVLFMTPGGVPTNTPTTYRELRRTTIAGVAARHVRMTVNPPGEHWQYDWYIDAQSLHVLRWVTLVESNGQRMASSYTYSGFGVPVRISPPGS